MKIASTLKLFFLCFRESIALMFKGQRRAIGIDLMSIGEFQFCRNVVELLLARFPTDLFYVFHHEDSQTDFENLYPHLQNRLKNLPYRCLKHFSFHRLDLYITNEQFVTGPPGVYTLTLFHGQPSKGVTFNLHGMYPVFANDALFLYGPLQRQALDEHLAMQHWTLPKHLSLFEIGYTKSDDLINGCYDRENILRDLDLDPTHKTILYAPAFNEGASLRDCGLEVLRTICQLSSYNILAKLPIDCLKPTSDITATGGVNWPETISTLENDFPNFRLFRDYAADKALACADVLITCVSSISFEFLALGKPVIFIDTPRFYEIAVAAFFPGTDVSGYAQRTTVNGGKEFGLVVARPQELPQALTEIFAHPDRYPPNKTALREYLLYNAGHATQAAVDKISELLATGVRSRRSAKATKDLMRRVQGGSYLLRNAGQYVRRVLNRYGYDIRRTGSGFHNADQIVAAAKQSGLSVCEYLENIENDVRKRGRRDRIIAELQESGVFQQLNRVCEIGAGTGQYLEKIMEVAQPANYEVYETSPSWTKFLQDEYHDRNGCKLICHPADGQTLSNTASNTCDLVHAHGVFIYLSLLQTVTYLKECARICRSGGFIVFDYYPAEAFTLSVADAWLSGSYRFPVVIPRALLDQFAQYHHLHLVRAFSIIHGASEVSYIVWQKHAMH
ncbi:MAG: methyltransferase domain-containing protein [Deltaproteobacteria bacterium]|nr:methyltransferase domain-containing protein [Deltaproteobacteria bacterium]